MAPLNPNPMIMEMNKPYVYLHNTLFPCMQVTYKTEKLYREIYTCEGFHMEVFFKKDEDAQYTQIHTFVLDPVDVMPLMVSIKMSIQPGRPNKIVFTRKEGRQFSLVASE